MSRLIRIFILAVMAGCTEEEAPASAAHTPSPHVAARFVRVDDGIVRDTRSGLLWTARDSEGELAWPAADARCRSRRLRSGSDASSGGWRLPTSAELGALYDESETQPCGEHRCRLDPAIDLTGPYQWTATARGEHGERRVYVDFRHASELAPLLRPTLTRRALCILDSAE